MGETSKITLKDYIAKTNTYSVLLQIVITGFCPYPSTTGFSFSLIHSKLLMDIKAVSLFLFFLFLYYKQCNKHKMGRKNGMMWNRKSEQKLGGEDGHGGLGLEEKITQWWK